jgi:beta-lactamase regulating signal transducer with metallopeptidase domain
LTWPAAIKNFARHPIVAGIGGPLINVNQNFSAMLPTLPSPTSANTQASWLGIALLIVWAIGLVAIVYSRTRAWLRLLAIIDESRPMSLSGVEIPGDVVVRAVPGLLEPGVSGWRRPILLMPADITHHLAPQQIAAIVAHELCHVRRRDNLTASLHMIAEALFWFHPMVWWIGARLVDERERACDEHVLQTVGQPASYAQGILNICKRYMASPLASVPGVSSSNVKKRVDAILANHVGEAIGPWQKVILGVTMVLVLVGPLGAGVLYVPRVAENLRAGGFVEVKGIVPPANHDMAFRPRGPESPAVGAAPAAATTIAYALVVAGPNRQLGPRLTPLAAAECDSAVPTIPNPCGAGRVSTGEIAGDRVTPTEVALLIGAAMNRQVEDRTGLTGRYNLALTWVPGRADLSVFTAVREQLGLTLVPIGLVEHTARVAQ